jgi:hypothetical protein
MEFACGATTLLEGARMAGSSELEHWDAEGAIDFDC